MKTDKAGEVSAQTTKTKFDGVLLTIRSRKSFFEVTQAIERNLQRFHTPKLMEYVTHGDRAGVEAYVNSTSTPFSIFWDFEQGSTMRLAGIPIESKFYLVGTPSLRVACSSTAVPPAWALPCASAFPSGTARRHASTWTYRRHSLANSRRCGRRLCLLCSRRS
jgi:hypothetical protein